MRKRLRRGVFVVGLLAVLVGLGMGLHFHALISSPESSYKLVAKELDVARAVIRPDMWSPFLVPLISAGLGAPQWALDAVLPWEVALLASPQVDGRGLSITVFMNERRLGPLVTREATAERMQEWCPSVCWASGFAPLEEGVLLAEGTLALRKRENQALVQHWPAPLASPSQVEITGGHGLEIALDNRSGGAYAVLAGLMSNLPEGSCPYDPDVFAADFAPIASVRIVGDLIDADQATLQIAVNFLAGTPEEQMADMAFLLDLLCGEAGGALRNELKLGLSSKVTRQAQTVRCEVTITGLDALCKRLANPEEEGKTS